MIKHPRLTRRSALALTASALLPASARAMDTLRTGKAILNSFPMATLEVGQEHGVFATENINLVISAFRGDGQMQQALTANAVDIGIGSGPGMGYAVKGVPARAVAAMASEPRNMALVVPKDGPVKTVADLKGKRVGVSTAGSLTDWLVRATAAKQGWGPEGIEILPMGEVRTRQIAMRQGQLEGSVTSIEEGVDFEETGQGRVLITFGDIVPDFHTHVIFATDTLIKTKPDVLRRFLRGWFKTVAFMKANRAASVKTIAKTTGYSEKIVDLSYDTEMGMISYDGAFSPKALEILRQSFKDLGVLDHVPEIKDIYNPDFSPVKLQ